MKFSQCTIVQLEKYPYSSKMSYQIKFEVVKYQNISCVHLLLINKINYFASRNSVCSLSCNKYSCAQSKTMYYYSFKRFEITNISNHELVHELGGLQEECVNMSPFSCYLLLVAFTQP